TPIPTDPDKVVTLEPAQTAQTMIGFGGGLTWYCDRITSSPHKAEIIDKMVNDLGLDMVRFKNWYYPLNYPQNKTPNQFEVSWFGNHYTATNELYNLLKQANPDIEVLLSAWGPPSALKSNGQLEGGTLKKENDAFMYDAYATWWEDVLDHLPFVPDYLSIQNEPTWVADWTTCEWRATETSQFPGYATAFGLVAGRLATRNPRPQLLGPESASLGYDAFDAFANALRDNPDLDVYGYHPYNFNESTPLSDIRNRLTELGGSFNDRPLIMTEYDGMSWMKTAQFINSTLREANTAAYLYWTLMWEENSDLAMFKIAANGEYELSPFYYLIKHYARYVDKGYQRIDLSTGNTALDQVAFLHPDGDRITVITLNPGQEALSIQFAVEGKTIKGITTYQSTEDSWFTARTVAPGAAVGLRAASVTTTVLELE
ncbi:MAG: hypothetical protein KDC54_24585, partial [Lewinella sp.]|nr:hypothetical protein [Lewinella sp.]